MAPSLEFVQFQSRRFLCLRFDWLGYPEGARKVNNRDVIHRGNRRARFERGTRHLGLPSQHREEAVVLDNAGEVPTQAKAQNP